MAWFPQSERPNPEGPSLEKVIDALRASINNQKRIIELVTAQTARITQGIEQQNDIIQQQNDTIKRQHESIAAFQNDLLLKSQKDLIMELIGIADNIDAVIQAQQKQPDYDTLLRDIKALAEWVDKSLLTAGVRSFSDVEQKPTEFNSARQEQKEVIITEDPQADGRLVSLQKGYIWAMPWLIINSEVQLRNVIRDNPEARQFQFVLRPELVARQRLNSTEAPETTESPEIRDNPETPDKIEFIDDIETPATSEIPEIPEDSENQEETPRVITQITIEGNDRNIRYRPWHDKLVHCHA